MKKLLLIFAAIVYITLPDVVLGQAGAAHFSANLTGDQQNPAVTTNATGTGTFSLTDAGLAYNITFEGITLTASHFHLAAAGTNGGVVRAIDFAGANTVSGIWTSSDTDPLTDALIADVIAGNIYVNLHTSANTGGELRGQVTLSGGLGFSANLTGDQENPPVTTAATGTGTFTLTDAGLAYNITFEGITIIASHFHLGATGVNGGVVRAIDFAGANTVSGIWTSSDTDPLTDALIADVIAGNIYVNLHTSANTGGELRGQLLPGIIEVPIGVVDEDVAQLPTKFQLKQNYPNPFNPATSIEYSVPYEDKIVLTIYNILGEEVVRLIDETQTAGNYAITWDAANIASGIYFYKLQSGEISLTKKMLLLK